MVDNRKCKWIVSALGTAGVPADRRLVVNDNTSGGSDLIVPLKLSVKTTGTPVPGIGVGMEFAIENTADTTAVLDQLELLQQMQHLVPVLVRWCSV